MAKRIEVPTHTQQYIVCIVMHLVFPLLPILFEYLFLHRIKTSTLTLTTALYSMALGLSSESVLNFFLSIFLGALYFAFYGVTIFVNIPETLEANPSILAGSREDELLSTLLNIITITGLGLVFALHCLERYNMHIIDRKLFIPYNQITKS